MPSPKIDSKSWNSYLNMAAIFGFAGPGEESSWKGLSGSEARGKHNQLVQLFEKMNHGHTCGCSTVVFTIFASSNLPQFMELYLKFARDSDTLIPFTLIFFRLVPQPYLGSYLRKHPDPQLLIQHQIRTFFSNRLQRLESTAFTTMSQLDRWDFEVSNFFKLALYLRTLLYHIAKVLDVPNPVLPSQTTSDLINAIEHLLPSLTYRLEVPFDRKTVIGLHPNRIAYKQFTETAESMGGKLNDALYHARPLLALLRGEEHADARTPFKYMTSSPGVILFPEDVCAFIAGMPEREGEVCDTDEMMTCSRCQSVVYCSKNHQQLDWKQHKNFCFDQRWGRSGEEASEAS